MIIIIIIYLISSLQVTTAAIQKCNQIWELHTFSQEHKNLKNLSVIILEVISFSSQEGTFWNYSKPKRIRYLVYETNFLFLKKEIKTSRVYVALKAI